MRKFSKIFLKSHGTYWGVGGGLTRPLVMVGFLRRVIFITYGMDYIAIQTDLLVYFLPNTVTSVPMCNLYDDTFGICK